MRLDAEAKIAGQSARSIRDLFRAGRSSSWDAGFIAERLCVPTAIAEQILQGLVESGLVELDPNWSDSHWYRTTLKGNQVALATFARPLTRAFATKKLAEFLDRVRHVNKDSYFLFRVTRVVLFGSMLGNGGTVSDVDVAVALAPKEPDRDRRFAAERERVREARRQGRHFSNLVDELSWPQREVHLFLKSRSRAISLHPIDDPILEQCEQRTIYEFGAGCDV